MSLKNTFNAAIGAGTLTAIVAGAVLVGTGSVEEAYFTGAVAAVIMAPVVLAAPFMPNPK